MAVSRPSETQSAFVETLLGHLTLEEKVTLLTGKDFWSTRELPRIGLRSIRFSDGPAGVRGPVWDERSPSISLPSGTTLGASWDVEVARSYGAAAAGEARRKRVDVVLGPTINLHRSPFGGRHFEALSEDPVLTGRMAAAYVDGVQALGVGATPKHYVANDSETDRFTADIHVDDRALHELYLRAFEESVRDAGAWLIMSAYNSVNGTTLTESELLTSPLRDEWDFDGVVISDWKAVRSLESARVDQDLVMPGPGGPWGDALVTAVRNGEIPERTVDEKIRRMLILAGRLGAIEGYPDAASPSGIAPTFAESIAFARTAAVEGSVLVRNEGAALPWEPSAVSSIAVIGDAAVRPRIQGGGSATVIPDFVVSPLAGVTGAFPDSVIGYAVGALVDVGFSELPIERLTDPVTGEPGICVEYLGSDGQVLETEHRGASALVWLGGSRNLTAAHRVRMRARYVHDRDEMIDLGYACISSGRMTIDDRVHIDATSHALASSLGAAFLSPPVWSAPFVLGADHPIDVVVECAVPQAGHNVEHPFALTLGCGPTRRDPEEMIAEAAELARASDVAIVVVGTGSAVESEGCDRESLGLPGHQDALVRAVAASNPRTVVIVNSGAPVLMPWFDDAGAVLITHFGGQQMGAAVGEMLNGSSEPGGRLTTTWPVAEADLPVSETTPDNGVLRYDEGIHIGYRGWLRADAEPLLWFGEGQGYTAWDLVVDPIERIAVGDDDVMRVGVTATNIGARAGKSVIQIFASRPHSEVDRPRRWLVGFAAVRAGAGESVHLDVPVHVRDLAYRRGRAWVSQEGAFQLDVGFGLGDLRFHGDVDFGRTPPDGSL